MNVSRYRFERFVGGLGNFLEHYDVALFGFLAPFLAPLIFSESEVVTALMLTYGMVPLHFCARPFGAVILGRVADWVGSRRGLMISLFGMALATTLMGVIPLYGEVGMLSPVLFFICRFLQGFFSAGETNIGAIFVLERTEVKRRSWVGSLYQLSSMGGIFFASLLVALLGWLGILEQYWRVLFLFSGVTAFCGVYLRGRRAGRGQVSLSEKLRLIEVLRRYWRSLLSIVVGAGFSHMTYTLAFTFMNGWIPLVTSLTQAEVLGISTGLLVLDFVLLIVFGAFAERVGREKLMLLGAVGLMVLGIPLFSLLRGAHFGFVVIFRVILIGLGVAFAAPYYAWAFERAPKEHRALVMSLGSALGAQLIGMPAMFCSFWVYKVTGFCFAPGVYMAFVALLAVMVLTLGRERESAASL